MIEDRLLKRGKLETQRSDRSLGLLMETDRKDQEHIKSLDALRFYELQQEQWRRVEDPCDDLLSGALEL